MSPSWYVSQEESTNDPYAGAVIELSDFMPGRTGIAINIIKAAVPFNLFWTLSNFPPPPGAFNHAWLKRGTTGEVHLIETGGVIASLEAYGSSPDYAVSGLRSYTAGKDTMYVSMTMDAWFTVSASANAEPGSRLIIARGTNGTIQAGLVGIQIVGSKDPSEVPSSYHVGKDESDWIRKEIDTPFDFSAVDVNYWKE